MNPAQIDQNMLDRKVSGSRNTLEDMRGMDISMSGIQGDAGDNEEEEEARRNRE